MSEELDPAGRLERAEATLDALRGGEVDAIVGRDELLMVRLRAVELALRSSQSRYQTLLGSIDQGFCVIEVLFDEAGAATDYRFLDVNAAFERHAGIADAVGRRVTEVQPEVDPADIARFGCVARSGVPVCFESAAGSPGRIREIQAFRIDGPAQMHVALLVKDITAARARARQLLQSEQALRRSEERWSAAIDHFAEGAIIADENEQVIYWNPAARRMHGLADERDGVGPLAKTPETFELWTADGARRLELDEWPMRRIHRGERIEQLELRLRRPDQGWEKIVTFSGAMVATPSGERLIFLSVSDLTEQRRTEAALRESEARFRRLADVMPQLVWTATRHGDVEYYNSRVSAYEGFERSDDGTWRWTPGLHPDDAARTERAWRDAIATGRGYECEHRVRMADGSYRWHLSRAHLVDSAAGGQWFGTATDVHDLKAAQDRLREADRRKDEFLALLGHELRNPLAPLRNGLQLLRVANLDSDTARKARAMMERQVAQMVRLIDDLLDTSRIAQGKFELRRERMDLVEAVRIAIETSRPLLDAGSHRLEVVLPERPLMMDGDPVRIAQVFTNLLNNAAHYTEPGGHVTMTVHQGEGEAVAVVCDDGAGIAEDMLERIFEPFLQLEPNAPRSNRHDGLGLGLALARNIVRLHGGTIRASRGETGRGSVFTVTLPVPDTAVLLPPVPAGSAGPSQAGFRVLVVDDNCDAAESLGLLLQITGHDVRVANDGQAALRAAQEWPPDLVLLDLGMPGMDGYEVARRLRQLPVPVSPRIVALSGYGQDADRRRSAEAGFDAHLVKPLDLPELEALLARLRR
jgi:PAS domain S-box-containing protein